MANEIFYPPISSIVSVDALPSELNFLKNGIATLLNNLYYHDLQFSKNLRGDSFSYTLTIISLQDCSFYSGHLHTPILQYFYPEDFSPIDTQIVVNNALTIIKDALSGL